MEQLRKMSACRQIMNWRKTMIKERVTSHPLFLIIQIYPPAIELRSKEKQQIIF